MEWGRKSPLFCVSYFILFVVGNGNSLKEEECSLIEWGFRLILRLNCTRPVSGRLKVQSSGDKLRNLKPTNISPPAETVI